MHWTAEYQRIPFLDKGRDWSGADCYGHHRLALGHRAGVWLPEYADISAFDVARIAKLMGGDAAREIPWIDVDLSDARYLDTLVMKRHGSRITGHVGTMVDRKTVMHTEELTGPVCVPISHYSIAPRIVAVRRHRALCGM